MKGLAEMTAQFETLLVYRRMKYPEKVFLSGLIALSFYQISIATQSSGCSVDQD